MSKKTQVTTAWLASKIAEGMIALDDGRTTPQSFRASVAGGNCLLAIKRSEMDFSRFVSTQRASAENPNALEAIPLAEISA